LAGGFGRADAVVVVGRQRDGRQDRDDRNHDHQFYQGEALAEAFHAVSSPATDTGPVTRKKRTILRRLRRKRVALRRTAWDGRPTAGGMLLAMQDDDRPEKRKAPLARGFSGH